MSTDLLDARVRFYRLIARIPEFQHVPEAVRQAFAAVAQAQAYGPGQMIYPRGEPATHIFLLERGWVKATRSSCQGREQATLFLRAPEIFGDIAVLTQEPYLCTVTTLESVMVWRIPAATFQAQLERCHPLALAFTHRLAKRVQHLVDLVEDLGLCSVETRVARTLLRHARFQQGRWVVLRQDWTTIEQMAIRLGTVRDVLNRVLRNLEREGLIEVRRREIVLRDPEGLAQRGIP
ncbi:MAG: Crp/Fnr family transcriptional regulator [Chloroflexi bacterium]|nr:Crp/Fnr family transcriptional regulator [Chloroflexota bacterium]